MEIIWYAGIFLKFVVAVVSLFFWCTFLKVSSHLAHLPLFIPSLSTENLLVSCLVIYRRAIRKGYKRWKLPFILKHKNIPRKSKRCTRNTIRWPWCDKYHELLTFNSSGLFQDRPRFPSHLKPLSLENANLDWNFLRNLNRRLALTHPPSLGIVLWGWWRKLRGWPIIESAGIFPKCSDD